MLDSSANYHLRSSPFQAVNQVSSFFLMTLIGQYVLPLAAAKVEKVVIKGCEAFVAALGYGFKTFLPGSKALYFIGTRHDHEQPAIDCINALSSDGEQHRVFAELGVSGIEGDCAILSNDLLGNQPGRTCIGWNDAEYRQEQLNYIRNTIYVKVVNLIMTDMKRFKKQLPAEKFNSPDVQTQLFDQIVSTLIKSFSARQKFVPHEIRRKIKNNNYQLKLFTDQELVYWDACIHLKALKNIRKRRRKGKTPDAIIKEKLLHHRTSGAMITEHYTARGVRHPDVVARQQASLIQTAKRHTRVGSNFFYGGMAHFFKPKGGDKLGTNTVTDDIRPELRALCDRDDRQCVILQQTV